MDDIQSFSVGNPWLIEPANRAFPNGHANIFGMGFVFASPQPPPPPLRAAIHDHCRIDETEAVARILDAAAIPANMRDRIADRARALVKAVRHERLGKG
ncbi:MAG TPA: hypothetical protein VE687_18090, partial [Stellaceae bacterium]|nr:hypothetical protein [Stellaceae bacterium]